MANDHPGEKYIPFILDFVATVRKGALYSATHPVVIASAKECFLRLQEIFKSLEALHISVSTENRIVVEGELLEGEQPLIAGVLPFLKKWQIEDITFKAGITEEELLSFAGLLLWDEARVKGSGGIVGALTQQTITHIQLNLFSYLRIRKGQEVQLAQPREARRAQPKESRVGALDLLKEKLTQLSRQKSPDPREVENAGREIFVIVIGECKSDGKISPAAKNMLTKFIVHSADPARFMRILEDDMLQAGIAGENAARLLHKIREAVDGRQKTGTKVSAAAFEEMKRENEGLKAERLRLRGELDVLQGLADAVQRQAESISDEKQKLDNIVHNMSDGMMVVDPDGRILMVNPAAQQLLGVAQNDIGKQLKDVIKDEHLLALVKKPAHSQEGSEKRDVELFCRDESTMRVLRASSAVIEDPQGKTVGMVAILNDITKQREVENLKQDFLGKVTHELRTPLFAMEKAVAILRSGSAGVFSETQENFLSLTETNLKRLTGLINDLLDLSKLEAGKMKIIRESADIRDVVAETLAMLGGWAQSKSILLRQEVAEGVPRIEFDAGRIMQVLNNLIGNAIKFTPSGGSVTVAVRLDAGGVMEVSVKDTGVGLAKDELSKVFDKFYQVQGAAAGDIRGTGIGLAIAREIVELHGGHIRVDSEQGKGTAFTFTIPPEH